MQIERRAAQPARIEASLAAHQAGDTPHGRKPEAEPAPGRRLRVHAAIIVVEDMLGVAAPDAHAIVDHPQPDGCAPVPPGGDEDPGAAAVMNRVVDQIAQRPLQQHRIQHQHVTGLQRLDPQARGLGGGRVLRRDPRDQGRERNAGWIGLDGVRLQPQVAQHVRQKLIG